MKIELKDKTFTEMLKAISGLLKLTSIEQSVLGEFLEYPDPKFYQGNRKEICDKLRLSIYSLNNYISLLKKKGAIMRNLTVSPIILKIIQDKELTISWTFRSETLQ